MSLYITKDRTNDIDYIDEFFVDWNVQAYEELSEPLGKQIQGYIADTIYVL